MRESPWHQFETMGWIGGPQKANNNYKDNPEENRKSSRTLPISAFYQSCFDTISLLTGGGGRYVDYVVCTRKCNNDSGCELFLIK